MKPLKLIPVAYAQPDIFTEPAKAKTLPKILPPITLFDLFLYFIAGISAAVSGYNSFLWFNSSNPSIIALALSIMLVSCSVIFPAIYRKTKAKLYLRLAFLTVGLSIFTTIAGQYNHYTIKHAAENGLKTASAQAGYSLTQLEADESRIMASIARINESISTTDTTIKAYLERGWYVGAQEKLLTGYQNEITNYNNQLNAISEQKRAAVGQVQAQENTRGGFYAFLAGIFGASADIIELIISCIFAGFIDILCPLVAYNIRKKGIES